MKKSILTFIFSLNFLIGFAQLKKDFKDFIILTLPENRQLVGTQMVSGSFVGTGLSEEFLVTSKSLDKYFESDTNKFKLEILDVLNSSLGLSNSSYQVTDYKKIEIIDCLDYGNLPLARNNQIVISSIRVDSVVISSKKMFNDSIKIDLSNYISNQNLKFTPDLSFEKNTAIAKMGKNLIVAVKVIKIESKPKSYIFSSDKASPVGNNSFTIFEPDFRSSSQIIFSSCDDLGKFISDTSQIRKHLGGITVGYTNPQASSSNGRLIGGDLLICPKRSVVQGLKRLPSDYHPLSIYEGFIVRPISALISGDNLYRYIFQVRNINFITYETGTDGYVLDKLDISWQLLKYVYKFSIVKK